MEESGKDYLTPEEQRIIFFNSYLPRTGHNFAAEALKVFSDHQVLPHDRSETRISTVIDAYFKIRATNFYESPRKFLDTIFMDKLREKILRHSQNKYVMIKDTSFRGVEQLPQIFPDDLHIILTRDPRNVFLSLLKGMNLKKNFWKNDLKKLGIPIGLYPYIYARKISLQVLENFPDLKDHTIIRYEDLVRKDEKTIMFLKNLFKTEKSLEQIHKEIDAIQVINSSFYEETGAKNIWDMKPKTSSFDPIKRKSYGFPVVKAIEMGSRKLRKKLNYI